MRGPQLVSVRGEQTAMVVHQSHSPRGSPVLGVIRVIAIVEIMSGNNNRCVGLYH